MTSVIVYVYLDLKYMYTDLKFTLYISSTIFYTSLTLLVLNNEILAPLTTYQCISQLRANVTFQHK